MAITITTPTDDQFPEVFQVDVRAFGITPQPDAMDVQRPVIDLSRFRIAVDGGAIIGVAGSFAFDVTLPGGATVPMSGVTWVSVAATHRRQGVLTRLMDAVHADTDDRGEPVAMLSASEGGIYGRFGYGIATERRTVTIDRAAARFRPDLTPGRGSVRYVDGDGALTHRQTVWEPFRRQRAGELSRHAAWHRVLTEMWSKPSDGMTVGFCLAHDEGYAVYRVGGSWVDDGRPSRRLEVSELVALTPQAHLDLWHALLGVDLVASVDRRALPVDDPLPYYFMDARVVRTTVLRDGMWANVRDVAVCFGTRTYGSRDRLVVEVSGKRWAIDSDGTESSCRSVRTRPDLVLDPAALGSLLLGGIRPSQLVAAGRAVARSTEVAGRADAFFLASPAPHSQTNF